MSVTRLLNSGRVPDRIRDEGAGGLAGQQQSVMDWVRELRGSRIAVDTDAANEQHYEVPAAFYERVLGHRRKYSSGLWSEGVTGLDAAEDAMLELYAERAALEDGQRVLDLGCGWGSFTLWAAARFPSSRFVGVSNSRSQRASILERAERQGLSNVEILTCDANELAVDGRFDRVVSVEMLEHVRNYRQMLERVAGLLEDDGLLFIHIFTHREFAYPFETEGDDNWMGRYFFTGGQMPSDHLLLYFQEHVVIDDHWRVSGTHYSKTSEAWLENFDAHRDEIRGLFAETYGDDARRMEVYWRVFFMACAELWGWNGGSDWFVSHYRFKKRVAAAAAAPSRPKSATSAVHPATLPAG